MKMFAAIGKFLVLGLLAPLLIIGAVHADNTTSGENGLIAYTKNIHSKSSVWVVRANGSQPALVASDFAQNPVWSPDGRMLAFTAGNANDCNTRLVLIAVSTMQQKVLAQGGCLGAPSWSANSASLAFSQTKKETHSTRSALFTIRTDTQQKTRVAGWSTEVMFRSPSWAPDNNRIVFEQYNHAESSLHIASLTQHTTSLLTILSDVAASSHASWSPSGRKIAYADSNNEIYTIWPDGSHRAVISDGDSYDASWSPDGAELLFLEDHSGEAISLSQSDGTIVQFPLSLHGYMAVERPLWSPDSSRALLMATTGDSRKDLVSIDLRNSQSAPKILVRNITGSASWQAKLN